MKHDLVELAEISFCNKNVRGKNENLQFLFFFCLIVTQKKKS